MKISLSILLYFTLIFLPGYGWAQTDNHNRDQADFFYRHFAFSEAIPFYRAIEERAFRDNFRLGDCYRLTNDPNLAAIYYGKALAHDDGSIPKIRLHYGQVLMTLEKYKDAEKWLAYYLKKKPSDRRTRNLIASCRTAAQRKAATPHGHATFLADLNTDRNEFAPTVWNNKLVFTSDSTYQVSKKGDKWTGNSFFNIYMASFDTSKQTYGGEITTAPRSRKENTRYHDGPCTFATDANEMYFTRTRYHRWSGKSKQNKDSIALLSIMVATEYDNAEMVFKKVRPFAFNSKSYSVAHPAISPDGRTLIFASNMKGGAGGYDLYICRRQANGEWLPPENLGTRINTEGDELFPYLADGKTLYFSSDGQQECLGGLDVYKSTYLGNSWLQAGNMGTPVNSSYDDISLALHEDGTNSYFSSNRPAKTAGDNIYLYQTRQLYVLIDVKDSTTKRPLPGASIVFSVATDTFTALSDEAGRHLAGLFPKFPYNYNVSVVLDGYDTFNVKSVLRGVNSSKDTVRIPVRLVRIPGDTSQSSSESLHRIIFNLKITDCRTRQPVKDTGVNVTFDTSLERINYYQDAEAHDGELVRELFPGKKYMLEVCSYDYKALYITKINTDFHSTSTTDTVIYDSVCLDQREEVIDLGLIPFGYDSSTLNDLAQSRLARFTKYLKELHPSMRLLIRGHTDCRESKPGYNKILSQERANAVMNYFISNGVAADRLRAIGVKDDMPRVRCNNCETDHSKAKAITRHYKNGKTDCSATDHAKNRYIDCVILRH